VRSALVVGAAVALISGVLLVSSGNSAQAAGLCSSVSSGTGSASISVANCANGFADGDDVTITGHGFPANQNVSIIMCTAAPTTTNDCDQNGADPGNTPADASGNINETFTVSQTFTTEGGTDMNCTNSGNCSVLVVNGIPTQGTGAYEDIPFGAPPTTTSTTGGSTTTTTGGSSTTTTTAPAAQCPTCGVTTSPSVTVSPTQASPGQTLTVSGKGFPAGSSVSINLCSTPLQLLTAVIDGSGNLASTTVTVPATAALGAHEIVVQTPNGSSVGVASLTLVAAGNGTVASSPVATPVGSQPNFTG